MISARFTGDESARTAFGDLFQCLGVVCRNLVLHPVAAFHLVVHLRFVAGRARLRPALSAQRIDLFAGLGWMNAGWV